MVTAARVSTVASDAIVLAVLLSRTMHVYQEAMRAHVKVPLIEILIRNGTWALSLHKVPAKVLSKGCSISCESGLIKHRADLWV